MAEVLSISSEGTTRKRWRGAFVGSRAPHRLVGETADLDEALRLRDERRPDVIMLELGDDRSASVAVCGRLADGDAAVVALAPRLDDDERAELLAAGATGYVLTTIPSDSLAIAIQAVAEVAGPDHQRVRRVDADRRLISPRPPVCSARGGPIGAPSRLSPSASARRARLRRRGR